MATSSDNSDAALAIAVLSLIVAAIAAAAGLMQLSWVKNYVCNSTGYLCDITYDFHVFKISYHPDRPEKGADGWSDPWVVLVDENPSYKELHDEPPPPGLIWDSPDNTTCINDDELRSHLADMHAVEKEGMEQVDFAPANGLGPATFIFYTSPLVPNEKVQLSQFDALMLYVYVSYPVAARDIAVGLDINVDDGFRSYSKFALKRLFTLPAGTTDTTIICRLFSPDAGYLRFTFDFADDSFGKTVKQFAITADSQPQSK